MRFLVIRFLGFAGFFRISELRSLQVKHITFHEKYMSILLEEAKTDQHRNGETIYIQELGHGRCPVSIVRKYMQMTELNARNENFLLSRLAKTKNGHRALGKYQLSYTRIRENFKEMINGCIVGKEAERLCLHSLRAGGASAAADNGVSDRLISKHGRWSSATSRDTYIKDSKKVRLSVTGKLGL